MVCIMLSKIILDFSSFGVIFLFVTVATVTTKLNEQGNEGIGIHRLFSRTTVKPVHSKVSNNYRGEVFIIRETDDPGSKYVAEIIQGGIEMFHQPSPPLRRKPLTPSTHLSNQLMTKRLQTSPSENHYQEVQEDPEYFAVLITPQAVALTRLNESDELKISLQTLTYAMSNRLPSVLVLKKQNHMEYFSKIDPVWQSNYQFPMLISQRRQGHTLMEHEKNTSFLIINSELYNRKDGVNCNDFIKCLLSQIPSPITERPMEYSDLHLETRTQSPSIDVIPIDDQNINSTEKFTKSVTTSNKDVTTTTTSLL